MSRHRTSRPASETDPGSKTDPPGLAEILPIRTEATNACLTVIRGRSLGLRVDLSKGRGIVLGRDLAVELPIEDAAASRRHAEVRFDGRGFTLSDLGSTNGLFVNAERITRRALRDGDRIQIGNTVVKFTYQDELEAEFHQQLFDSATRDALTGLLNRKYFWGTLGVELRHARRNRTHLALLMLDVDHFKVVNDRHGHLAGDAVLKHLGEVTRDTLRPEDLVCRYGGEELAVLLRFTPPRFAYRVAERLRAAIAAADFQFAGQRIPITVSIGVTGLEDGNHASPEEMVAAADRMLYQVKNAGRNGCASDLVEGPPEGPIHREATMPMERVGPGEDHPRD